jgi:hypothetical protein
MSKGQMRRHPSEKREGWPSHVRYDATPVAVMIPKVQALIAEGYNVKQIAKQCGVTQQRLWAIAREGNFKLPALTRTWAMKTKRVVEETVTLVSAAAHGIEAVRNGELQLSKEEAKELHHELKTALVTMYQLSRWLKEIAESTYDSETSGQEGERSEHAR